MKHHRDKLPVKRHGSRSSKEFPMMKSDEFAANVRKSAEDSFTSGLHCAESVVLALAKAQGIESEMLPKVATAFGGGMSRTCGTCGALTGAIMGVGLALGRSKAEESVAPSYAATQKLIKEFEQEFGSRECHVLLGCDLGTPEGQEMFIEEGLRAQCTKFTGKAAEIAARIVSESNS
jgi:C_GCAxxG_C_C family probable redox protein